MDWFNEGGTSWLTNVSDLMLAVSCILSPFPHYVYTKVFTLAQIMDVIGPQAVVEKIGVEPTGLPFNSILALGLYNRRPSNPLVNAGVRNS